MPPTTTVSSTPRHPPVRIVLYGDSLAVEAQSAFEMAVTGNGRAEVRLRTFVGTAICDHFEAMRIDLREFHPDAVVMEFSGNALTPCVNHEPLTSTDVCRRYHSDADAVMAIYEPLGVPVYWVGTPISRNAAESGDPNWALLNQMYSELPRRYAGAFYVNAGQAVMRDGKYTDELPCLSYEPCQGIPDAVTGEPSNRVRSPDGMHFCPVRADAGDGSTSTCPVWSSGAWRFGLAMAEPIVRDFRLDVLQPAADNLNRRPIDTAARTVFSDR